MLFTGLSIYVYGSLNSMFDYTILKITLDSSHFFIFFFLSLSVSLSFTHTLCGFVWHLIHFPGPFSNTKLIYIFMYNDTSKSS